MKAFEEWCRLREYILGNHFARHYYETAWKTALKWVLNHPDSPGKDALRFIEQELQE